MTTMATATVLGGFWPTNGVNTLASISGEGEERRQVAKALGHRAMLPTREIWRALTGAAPGGLASKSYTRVAAGSELGGLRPIETVQAVNRVTTAADAAEIIADFLTYTTRTTFGATPPANLDRNPLGTR
jgi:hypothetical protein